MVVRGIGGLEVGGGALAVDQLQVVRKEPHANALPTEVRMRAEEAQVVVRLIAGMVGVESREELQVAPSLVTQVLSGESLETLLLFGRHLGAVRWYPDGRGLASRRDPGLGVAQRTVDEDAPELRVVMRAATLYGHGPAPKWIVGEGERHDARDVVGVNCFSPSSD